VGAQHAHGKVGDVHGAALALAVAVDPAEQLGHHPPDVGALGDAVAVAAVGAGHAIGDGERRADADGDRLLTHVGRDRAVDLAGEPQLDGALVELADHDHRPQHLHEPGHAERRHGITPRWCRRRSPARCRSRTTIRPRRGRGPRRRRRRPCPRVPWEDAAAAASQDSRFSSTSSIMSVAIGPGCTELQRMLSLACWLAVDLVKSRTAPWWAVYAAVSPGLPTRPAVDEMLMMEPPPDARIAGSAHFVPRNTPLTLTAMMRSHSVSLVSSIRARKRMPALLTRTLSLP